MVKNLPANAGDTRDEGSIPVWEDPLEGEMVTQSRPFAWRIPWTEELVSYGPWGCAESATTEHTRSSTQGGGLQRERELGLSPTHCGCLASLTASFHGIFCTLFIWLLRVLVAACKPLVCNGI